MDNLSPRLGYMVLAEKIIVNAENKQLTLINLFDALFIPKAQTALYYSFFAVGRIYLKGGNIQGPADNQPLNISITIVDPDNIEFSTIKLSGQSYNISLGINLTAQFTLLKFEKVGRYTIRIVANGQSIDVSATFLDIVKL